MDFQHFLFYVRTNLAVNGSGPTFKLSFQTFKSFNKTLKLSFYKHNLTLGYQVENPKIIILIHFFPVRIFLLMSERTSPA